MIVQLGSGKAKAVCETCGVTLDVALPFRPISKLEKQLAMKGWVLDRCCAYCPTCKEARP